MGHPQPGMSATKLASNRSGIKQASSGLSGIVQGSMVAWTACRIGMEPRKATHDARKELCNNEPLLALAPRIKKAVAV